MKVPTTRYRQINLIFVVLLGLMVINISPDRFQDLLDYGLRSNFLRSERFIYLVLWMVFLVLLVLPERPWSYLLQIHLFLAFGVVANIFITPAELGGDLLFLLAAGLAYRYGFLSRRGGLKLGFIVVLLMTSRLAAIFVHRADNEVILLVNRVRFINQISIILVMIGILYLVFERELQQIRREKQRLERLQDENSAFVEFAHNVSGLVHDFKNDLGLFDTFGQLLRISEHDQVDRGMIDRYHGYLDRFSRRVNSVLSVTRSAHRQEPERVDIVDLVSATTYVFQSNLLFKRVVTFDISLPEDPVYVRVRPAPLTSILENLIRNGCEALVEEAGDSAAERGVYRLSVSLIAGPTVRVLVRDNGPGIPFCDNDGEENCLMSPRIVAGRTTKENGSGIGLVTIRRHSQRGGIPVDLRSRKGEGTWATIELPFAPALESGSPPAGGSVPTSEHSIHSVDATNSP